MQKVIPLEPSKYYHIYDRGNNRENIFFEERNYHYFMKLYAKYIEPVAETFAYCLMRNHFHLLVRIKTHKTDAVFKTASVSETASVLRAREVSHEFNNLLNSYAKSINKAYQRTGALFQSHFGRIEVTSDRYFLALINYIHRNPQKHKFVDDFRDYPYSSYHTILSTKPTHVKREEVLEWFGNKVRFEEFHQSSTDTKPIEFLIEDDGD